MEPFHTVLLSIGVVLVVAGLFWLAIERLWLTPPLLALVVGIVLGPDVSGAVDPAAWGLDVLHLVEQVTWLTLGISLFAIGVHLPPDYVWRHVRPLFLVAVVGTVLMWLASGLVVGLAFDLGVVPALLIGAAMAPTDPVLAGTITTGPEARKNVPARLRHLLYAESATNDGLALAVVMLSTLLWTHEQDASAWQHWLWHTLLWQVLCGALFGAVAGFIVGWLQGVSERFKLSDQRGMLAMILALSVAVLGGLKLLGTDALLGVFVAGVCFHFLARDTLEQSQDQIQDAMQRFFQLPSFMLLGALLPWTQWAELGWAGVGLVVGILLVRRLPAWLLLKPAVGPMKTWRDALFLGWFGPIGLSAVFYATLAHRHTHLERIWPIVTLVVTASIVVHGITATPLTHHMGRHEPPGSQ